MGLKFKDIIPSTEIAIDDLAGKKIAIDTYNLLYQFLTTVRSADGSLLTNANGDVTSHLSGLLSRIIHFLERNIQPVFVFDGKPPELKTDERKRRRDLKEEAQDAYEVAAEQKDHVAMKKYASRTTRITPEILSSTKKLLEAFGLPIVEAPSEGEAQVAQLVRDGIVDYAVSQDFDTLLHGAHRLIRNLSLSNKRKKKGAFGYTTVKPELILLKDVLECLEIDRDQLIVVAILTGTDYNYGGINGIGQKRALKLVKEYGKTHGTDYDALFASVSWDETFEVSWKDIYDLIHNMPVKKQVEVVFREVDNEAVLSHLCDAYGFGRDRIENQLARLDNVAQSKKQSSLSKFF